MTFQIIKNAPDAPIKGQRGKYPFGQLEVGDAFDAPLSDRASISACAPVFGKRHGMKFATRKVSDDTVRTFRVA